MLPFRKIVFPIDYSDSCTATVPYVKDLVQRFGSQLSLVHVYGAEALAYSPLPLTDPDLPSEAKAGEHDRLRKFAGDMFPNIHVETAVVLGEPGSKIRGFIQHQQADLIVMPTHGRGLLRRMLLGSVTAKLLHDVSAAVWTISPSALERKHHRYHSILCACDLDNVQDAEAVLRAGMALARDFGSSLSIVNTIEMTPGVAEFDYVRLQQEIKERAHNRLRELTASLGVDAPHRILLGRVDEAIQEEIRRTEADLVIVGRGHDQCSFGRVWSQLYSVVRESSCPVLSI